MQELEDSGQCGSTTKHHLNVAGNVRFTNVLAGSNKEAIRTSDAWLRLNSAGDFTAGSLIQGLFRATGISELRNRVIMGVPTTLGERI